jgi:hypothetical protein
MGQQGLLDQVIQVTKHNSLWKLVMYYVLLSAAMMVDLHAVEGNGIIDQLWTLIRQHKLSDGCDDGGRMLLTCETQELRDQIEELVANYRGKTIHNSHHMPQFGDADRITMKDCGCYNPLPHERDTSCPVCCGWSHEELNRPKGQFGPKTECVSLTS